MKKKAYTLSPELEKQPYEPSYPAWTVLVFFATLLVGFVLAFLIFWRPSYSEEEKRPLASFPSFSMTALLDGSYFDDIDLWFSDTFPMREEMVGMNARVQALYGLRFTAVYIDTSATFDDDEIPTLPATRPVIDPTTTSTTISSTGTTTEPTTEDSTTVSTTPSTTASTTASTTTTTTAAPTTSPTSSKDATEPTDAPPVQQLGSVLVVGNTAYEYYNFSQSAANLYIDAVNRAASRLSGKATVYDMLIPLAMDITLDDSIRAGVRSADQKKAIDYIYGSLSDTVRTIDVYTPLREHRNEYLYFRTDHHWTATGAYYAYAAFCAAKGVTPPRLTDYETMNFEGYLGSFYTSTGKLAALGNTPDTVTAYLPMEPTTLQFTDRQGKVTNWKVIEDVSGWNPSVYYNTFIGGDNPYTVIQNTARSDGSSCVVIKESFGNAFVPFLTANYQTIYVLDYRYYDGELVDFVTQNGVQDVIFINNMSASRSATLMENLDGLVGTE